MNFDYAVRTLRDSINRLLCCDSFTKLTDTNTDIQRATLRPVKLNVADDDKL